MDTIHVKCSWDATNNLIDISYAPNSDHWLIAVGKSIDELEAELEKAVSHYCGAEYSEKTLMAVENTVSRKLQEWVRNEWLWLDMIRNIEQ